MVNHKLQAEIEALNNRVAVHYIVDNERGIIHGYFADTPEGVSELCHGARTLSLPGVENMESVEKLESVEAGR